MRELAGLALGAALAPLAALISGARRARMFHPVGRAFRARVAAREGLSPEWAALAARLSGPALARFSGALWRGSFEHFEVLGVALRLSGGDEPPGVNGTSTDQDLLFATIRSPLTMIVAPLTTNAHDYLANHYWAVSPFDAGLARHVKFRLAPGPREASRRSEQKRDEQPRNRALVDAVRAGPVTLELQVRRTFEFAWRPLASVTLLEPLEIDQEALRFSPFRTGKGIVPSGFVHALRRATYAASQSARPAHS